MIDLSKYHAHRFLRRIHAAEAQGDGNGCFQWCSCAFPGAIFAGAWCGACGFPTNNDRKLKTIVTKEAAKEKEISLKATVTSPLASEVLVGVGAALIACQGETDQGDTPTCDFPCLLYTSPSPRDQRGSRMPSSA